MRRRHIAWAGLMSAALLCTLPCASGAQAPPAATQSPSVAEEPVVLDHVIGIINGDVLLESDVQSELHFALLQPYTMPAGENSRQLAAERLINRTLILQQMDDPQQLVKVPEPSEKDVQTRIDELRKVIPACKRYKCETAEGWSEFLNANGFTQQQVEQRWRERLRILQFTEARFRSGIRVPRAEIEAYYEKDLLPQYAKEKVSPPALNTIEARIEEILLQEKVNVMLQDWLKSLRDQGSVLILDPSYAPSSPTRTKQPEGSA
jgi:peptidyl-prolyl cis-trans isomerase SurA